MISDVAALYVDPRGSAERFWAKVNKNGPTVRNALGPCWEWTASKDRKGYGQFGVGSKRDGSRRPIGAHRFSWWLHTGEKPELCVLHKCDNPACVRPEHLYAGTIADNNRDMFAKGRANVQGFTPESLALAHSRLPRGDHHYARTNPERLARGERHGKTKLTVAQVHVIRAARSAGAPLQEIADYYGIKPVTVSAICRRRNWRHVP